MNCSSASKTNEVQRGVIGQDRGTSWVSHRGLLFAFACALSLRLSVYPLLLSCRKFHNLIHHQKIGRATIRGEVCDWFPYMKRRLKPSGTCRDGKQANEVYAMSKPDKRCATCSCRVASYSQKTICSQILCKKCVR